MEGINKYLTPHKYHYGRRKLMFLYGCNQRENQDLFSLRPNCNPRGTSSSKIGNVPSGSLDLKGFPIFIPGINIDVSPRDESTKDTP